MLRDNLCYTGLFSAVSSYQDSSEFPESLSMRPYVLRLDILKLEFIVVKVK